MNNWLRKQIDDYEIGHRHVSFEYIVREYNRMVLFVVPFCFVVGALTMFETKLLPISIPLIVLMVGILVIMDNRLENRRNIEVLCKINNIDDFHKICPKCSFIKYDGSNNKPKEISK